MKIKEARQVYGAQIQSYREQLQKLQKQKEELEKNRKLSIDGKMIYEKEAAILELTMERVTKKQEEYEKYMEQVNQLWAMTANLESAKQQGENAEEYYKDIAKIMEVARRIMQGGIVPPQDEKKLMEYSMELYQTAKSMGAMVQQRKREEYDSLWEEEKEKQIDQDPMEVADNMEAPSPAPSIQEGQVILEATVTGK